jgi:hypothetical protein
VTVRTPTDQPPLCAFCDGTGTWPDPDSDAPLPDPCPLCNGDGRRLPPRPPAADPDDRIPLVRLLAALPGLTAEERQLLYEELYRRWDCRIYRG